MKTPLADIEARIHSQNGEDGIIQHLLHATGLHDRTVVEIGAGNGHINNSRALLEAGWIGLLIEKNPQRARELMHRADRQQWACEVREQTADLSTDPGQWEPVVFSLDIDSYDYHVARSLLVRGFRPMIAVVEYNAALDPALVTVPWGVRCWPHLVYFGASLAAMRTLWESHGYRFVTVCSAGINAFFVRESAVDDATVLDTVAWLPWSDCAAIEARAGSLTRRRQLLSTLPVEKVHAD